MGKPQLSRSKPAQTSSSPEPPRSTADQAAIGDNIEASAAAEAEAPRAPTALKTRFCRSPMRATSPARRSAARDLRAPSSIAAHLAAQALSGPAPDRLLAHPRCFYRKEPRRSRAHHHGPLPLARRRRRRARRLALLHQAAERTWLESLHGFPWLRHFDAGGVRAGARTPAPTDRALGPKLTADWHELAWRPHVLARRLMTWSSFGRLILLQRRRPLPLARAAVDGAPSAASVEDRAHARRPACRA